MRTMQPDAVIEMTFLTTEEGGRKSPIEGDRYGCPIMVDGHGFDCRFVLGEASRLELGRTYQIGVKFLSPDLAMAELKEGDAISLSEGKTIATGKVLKLRGGEMR